MSDETELPPGPEVVFIDPFDEPALFVDWIVTGGSHEGVVNVTLGVLDHSLRRSEKEPVTVKITTKLRFTEAFARRLHAALGGQLGIPSEPQEAPQVSKNRMN